MRFEDTVVTFPKTALLHEEPDRDPRTTNTGVATADTRRPGDPALQSLHGPGVRGPGCCSLGVHRRESNSVSIIDPSLPRSVLRRDAEVVEEEGVDVGDLFQRLRDAAGA